MKTRCLEFELGLKQLCHATNMEFKRDLQFIFGDWVHFFDSI